MKRNLIWIASYPKSGNTWLRCIIYTALRGRLDLNELGKVVPAFNSVRTVEGRSHTSDLADHCKNWLQAQRSIAESQWPSKTFLKTHNSACRINDFLFPSTEHTYKVVYIVRNPRDVATSYARHFNCGVSNAISHMLNEKNIIHNERQAEFLSSWNNHVGSWMCLNVPTLVIRFEDLKSQTEVEIRRLFQFLNLKPVLSLPDLVKQTSFESLKSLERRNRFVESVQNKNFFWRGATGEYEKIKPAELVKMADQFSEVMKRLNYDI
jgi:hypothetical protein